jgi:hypothetical protein
MDYIEYRENKLLNDYYDEMDLTETEQEESGLSYEDGKREAEVLYGEYGI